MREEDLQHGAIKINWLHRLWHKFVHREALGYGIGIDYNAGSQFRILIGTIPIKNQGQNFSCSGQAATYFLEIDRRIRGVYDGELSAKSLYAPIAYKGGGTTVNALTTQLCAHGTNFEKDVPSYDAYGNPLSESMMEEKSWMTPTLTNDALNRAGYTPIDVPRDIDSVASAINQYGTVIMEIQGQNGNMPPWTSAYPQPPSSTNTNPLWQHFLCAYDFSIRNGKKYVHVLESMGTSWGENGIQYIGEDYFESGHILDVVTFIHDDKLVPTSSNYSIWAALVLWFRMRWGLS